jgi:Putative DnaT-like ssDNA binding protein
MAFVVEDGTAKSDANSYVAIAEADGYFSDRGIIAWTGADAVKQAVLVKATDYIEGRFGQRFIGSKKTTTQALSWPREDACDFADTEIPVKLRYACCEYALRALTAELAPDIKVDASGLTVVETKKMVGPIEADYAIPRAGLGSTPMLFRPYPAADMLLRGLVYSASQVIR